MKRLRHPIRAIREPFGTAGLIVAMIALVAALGGTALAAAKLNSTQKKEVEKIAKKYAGKPGAAGATGPAGAPGAAGAAGPAGKNGTAGTNGTNGKEGSPWTAGGTLPKGSSEKGFVVANIASTSGGETGSGGGAVSFGIPLSSAPSVGYVNPSGEEEISSGVFGPPAHCHGSFENPSAPEGFLCLYGFAEIAGLLAFEEAPHVTPVGAIVNATGHVGLGFTASWAVTGS